MAIANSDALKKIILHKVFNKIIFTPTMRVPAIEQCITGIISASSPSTTLKIDISKSTYVKSNYL